MDACVANRSRVRGGYASVVATRCGWSASLDFTAAADVTPEGFVVKQQMNGTSRAAPLPLTPHALGWSLSTSAHGEKLAQRLPCAAVDKRFKTAQTHAAGQGSAATAKAPPLPPTHRWLRTPDGAHGTRAALEKKLQDFVTPVIRPRPVAHFAWA